ncbi:mechanosensitive ion channel family protein [Phenylobacterium sp.]|jgi:small conductance mechanosensitive channel|uniref:mechanosensitive ion channel family protein n=1 Tax=Phenylobacterium sp. TaxID=1871053 RepID=UPI0037833192
MEPIFEAFPTVAAATGARGFAWSKLIDAGGDLAINLAVAALTLALTIWASRWASRLARAALARMQARRGDADVTLATFAASMTRNVVLVVGLVAVLQQLGVKTTSIIAVLGAASLAVGLALQGALSNVAAGVMILLLRPYRVGDVIESAGRTGRVEALDLFVTELATPDNLKVVIPNGKLFGDVIVNHTFHDRRRADVLVRLPLVADVQRIEARLRQRLDDDPRVDSTPAPVVELTGAGEVWVELAARPWVAREDLAAVKSDVILCARLLEQDPEAELPALPAKVEKAAAVRKPARTRRRG